MSSNQITKNKNKKLDISIVNVDLKREGNKQGFGIENLIQVGSVAVHAGPSFSLGHYDTEFYVSSCSCRITGTHLADISKANLQ